MSQSREADRIILGPVVDDVARWLAEHGIERVAAVELRTGQALIFQESYRAPLQLVMPGDVLRAVDLGGTSGIPVVIHGGPQEEPS
jgi:hypothetical protein